MYRIVFFASLLLLVQGNESIIKINQIVTALEKLMDFFENDPSDPILDLSFGIMIARGQLETVLKYTQNNLILSSFESTFNQLINRCNKFLQRPVHTSSPIDKEFSEQVLQHNLRPDGRRPSRTLKSLGKAPIKKMLQDPNGFLVSPLLDENTSDHCIFELYKGCRISKACRQAEGLRPRVTGYSLTHRLLYIQISTQLNCTWPRNKGKFIEVFCGQILTEALAISNLNFPKEYQDLFIEQLTLCGLEGFREFVNLSWIDTILEWQTNNGCYRSANRVKRDDALLSFGCSAHTSGISAALFATLLRLLGEDSN